MFLRYVGIAVVFLVSFLIICSVMSWMHHRGGSWWCYVLLIPALAGFSLSPVMILKLCTTDGHSSP